MASAATGLAFLKISADASSSALGENTAAGWRDALSPVGNPALAPADGRTHVALTQADWIFDSRYTAMAVSAPVGAWTAGADLRVLSADGFELRDGPDPDPQGEFSLSDLAVGLSLSRQVAERLRLGAALRRVQEKLYNEDSQGWAGDLGLRWERPTEPRGDEAPGLLALSAAARNLGYTSEFVNEAPDPPRQLSLGAEWRGGLPLGGRGGVQVELRQLRDDGVHVHAGLEARPHPALALRGGWMGGYDDRGATLGVGFAWKALRLDYAWLPFSSALDDVHRFTFAFAL